VAKPSSSPLAGDPGMEVFGLFLPSQVIFHFSIVSSSEKKLIDPR
jgi:hypothetical protein